jgi:hypothetical protein
MNNSEDLEGMFKGRTENVVYLIKMQVTNVKLQGKKVSVCASKAASNCAI